MNLPTTINHDFTVQSVKTSKKDGQKYLGKEGTQAWRVSTKIGEEWFACMVYDEEFLPKKGQTYNIELSENEGFKNWAYKLLSKKEQVLGEQINNDFVKPSDFTIPTPTSETDQITNPTGNMSGRGASYNLAFQFCLYKMSKIDNAYENNNEFLDEVDKLAETIAPRQSNFVNKK